MKKMVSLLAVVLIAGLAQAASIDWAITGANPIKNTAGGNFPGGVAINVYLVLDGYQDGIVSAIKEGTFSAETAGVLDARLTSTTAHNIGVAVTATSALLTRQVGYQYAVLAFNETYTGVEGSSGHYQFSVLSPEIKAYTPPDDATQATFTADDFNSANWTGYTVVPEPTSMALLALGVAALGLRRKFRA